MLMHAVDYNKMDFSEQLHLGHEAHYVVALMKCSVEERWQKQSVTSDYGSLIFLRPGEEVFLVRKGDFFIYDYEEFSPNEPSDSILNTLPLPCGHRVPPSPGELSNCVKTHYDTYFSSNVYRKEILSLGIKSFLYAIASGDETPESALKKSMHTYKLRRLRTLISDNPEKWWTVEEAAAFIGVSRSRFFVLYKECFEHSFNSDMARVRIQKSRALLRSTDLSIADIAYSLGYKSPKFFYRQFKEQMGISPGEYRKLNIQAIY